MLAAIKFERKLVKIKEGTVIDGYDYSNLTGETLYVGSNGIWWVNFDDDSLGKLGYEYIMECKMAGDDYKSCCFEEKNLIFL